LQIASAAQPAKQKLQIASAAQPAKQKLQIASAAQPAKQVTAYSLGWSEALRAQP